MTYSLRQQNGKSTFHYQTKLFGYCGERRNNASVFRQQRIRSSHLNGFFRLRVQLVELLNGHGIELQQFDIEIHYSKGNSNCITDQPRDDPQQTDRTGVIISMESDNGSEKPNQVLPALKLPGQILFLSIHPLPSTICINTTVIQDTVKRAVP